MSDSVPKGWSLQSLEGRVEIISGFPFQSSLFCNDPNRMGVIRIRDLAKQKLETFYNGEFDDVYIVRKGDILIGMDGDFNIVKWKARNALLNQRICKIKSLDGKGFYTDFLFYSLADDLEKIHSITGATTVKHLSVKDLRCIEKTYPPLPEQQKIAIILSSVDDVIEKTRAQINKLEDLKTGMMQELLTKGIGHTEFKDSSVGRIPTDWTAITIGDLINSRVIDSVQDGNHGERHPKASDYSLDGIPFIMASDIHDQEIDTYGANKIPENIYQHLRIGCTKPGDVLLSHKATVGLTAVVPENIERLMLTPQVTYYRVGNKLKLFNLYLHYWFQSSIFQEMVSILSTQSTRSYIGIKAQRELLVALPADINEQKDIVNVLQSVDKKRKLQISKLARVTELKKALMQDLLTGKVRVKIDHLLEDKVAV